MSNRVTNAWLEVALGEHAYVKARIGWRGLSSSEYTESGAYLIAGTHIKGARIEWEKCDHIDDFRYEESPEIQLREHDVVISKDGTLGRLGYVENMPGPATINGTMMLIRPEKTFYPKFIYFYLQGDKFQKIIKEKTSGSSVPHIFQRDMVTLVVPCPPLLEQRKIASILSSVDDVIEKTRVQIDKLKDLKIGMMQELLTKGIGHTEFKDSPLGRIPSSWNVTSLGVLSSFVTSGSRGWAQYYSTNGAIFIRIGNLTREHINLRFDDTVYVTPPASAEGKRTQVKIGDVLISITADLGVIGVVNESIGEAFVNQHISLVRLDEPALARWVGHFLAFENSQKQFVANNDAGAKAGLNLTAIRKTLVAIPTQSERERIVASLDSVDQDVSVRRDRLQQFMNLKKGLMQDLLTDKVRVTIDQKEPAVA